MTLEAEFARVVDPFQSSFMQRALLGGISPDYLTVETTGLTNPLPGMLTFLNTGLKALTRLDSVITVVDATAFDAEHFL